MDDTLYDEIDYCKSGFEATARTLGSSSERLGEQELFNAFWDEFNAGNHTAVFNAALDKLNISYDQQFIQRLIGTYRRHAPSIKLPEESRDVLDELNDKYILGLLTDGFLPAQQLKVKALGIEKYFKCIIYTEQLGREFWKPSPAGFRKIAQQLNAKGRDCVYIADNAEKDFIAPNQLGFSTIQILRPNRIRRGTSSDENAIADYVIESLQQLPGLLAGL